ncbi:HDOD domain-containing protein [Thiolapillus sp.]
MSKSLKEMVEEQMESGELELPIFNQVALDLQRMKNEDDVQLDQIIIAIMTDPALAVRILKVANSSFYGGLKEVSTIQQAVIRLGLEQVANIALMSAQAAAHDAQLQKLKDRMPGLWEHAYVSAMGARWLAKEAGLRDRAEEAFLAGLLHDVGELVLLKILDQHAGDADIPPLTDALINEALEVLHPELGHRLMTTWELPGIYADVARNHHQPNLEEPDALHAIVRLVDGGCAKVGVGQRADDQMILSSLPEAGFLDLNEIQLAEFEVVLEDVRSQAGTLL